MVIIEIVSITSKMKRDICDLECVLRKLRGNDWLKDIEKDERESVKVLYTEYERQLSEYNNFMSTEVVYR